MKMWVFRIPTGPGGDPRGKACDPNELNASEMALGNLASSKKCILNYVGCLEFILKELFDFQNLRQG
jgi:hypothetical protein